MTRLALCLCLALALQLAPTVALAAPDMPPAPAAPADPADKLRDVQQQLNQGQTQQQQLDSAAQDTAKTIDALRDQLIRATQNLQDKQAEEDGLEDRQNDLTTAIAAKSRSAASERGQLAAIISALLQVASRPPVTLFMQKHVTTDQIHRGLLLHAALPGLKAEAESTAADLASLYDLQTRLATQKKLVAAAQANLQQQRGGLDGLIAARQGALQKTEAQKAEIARQLAALSGEAQSLRQLMDKLAAAKKAPPITKGGKDSAGLKWPVAGAVQRQFGDKDSAGVVADGITLTAPSGAPVVAPRAGKVVFAGPFRSYGQIVIMQHPGGYHSFLAGFGRIDAEMGQDVAAGEPLGVLPVKPGTHPALYFEWRKGEEPVDPRQAIATKTL